jgi:hypothetical protein
MRLPLTRGARWTGEGDRAHPGDVAVFIVAVVGFLILFAVGVIR